MHPANSISDEHREVEYASPWKRLAALAIDLPVIAILAGVTRYLFVEVQGLDILVVWIYFATMEGSGFQGTFGKKVLGLQVTGLDGARLGFWRASGRYWLKLISLISLGAGFVMVFFTDRKQAFHDYLVGSVVLAR